MLTTVNLTGYGKKYQGKVRDWYIVGARRPLIATDRVSAFDRVLGFIPHKGQVLNLLSAFWFEQTKGIIANHHLSVPDPNVSIVRNCKPYPIEMVVRRYITGVTKTSLWYNYAQGERNIYGLSFSDGLKKNQKLEQPIITPTTRGKGPGGHDEKITKEEILQRGIVSPDVYEHMEKAALALFEKGTEICDEKGIILVDTKYEFGDNFGELTLIDELHTPDSSRFWLADDYKEKFGQDKEPGYHDKEFFRRWYVRHGFRGDGVPPVMPPDYIYQVSQRYRALYERVTGCQFRIWQGDIAKRIEVNLASVFNKV